MKNRLITLGLIYYCYALCAGIAFQVLLPYVLPKMVAPGALLTTDSQYFHEIATEVANRIQTVGWSSWSPFPNTYTAFNVALLGAAYAIFGVDPKLAVPLNAAFHSASAILLLLIVYNLSQKSKIGLLAGLVTSLIFLIFPSALNWYGQIHKDSFVIFGVFSFVLSFVILFESDDKTPLKKIANLIFACAVALYLISICRPYYLNLIPIFFAIYLVNAILALLRKKRLDRINISILVYMGIGIIVCRHLSLVVAGMGAGDAHMGMTYANAEMVKFQLFGDDFLKLLDPSVDFIKIHLGFLYEYINKDLEGKIKLIEYYVGIFPQTRQNLILYSIRSGSDSLVDSHVVFRNMFDIIGYLPRALIVAIFAPFPTEWFSKLSIIRLVSYIEMAISYFAFVGCFGFIKNKPAFKRVLPILTLAAIFMVAFGLTIANVGTLYRVRYSFEFLLIAVGIFGWTFLAPKFWIALYAVFRSEKNIEKLNKLDKSKNANFVKAGMLFTVWTSIGFLLFTIRDIEVGKVLGFNSDSAIFFIYMFVPMAVINIISAPYGAYVQKKFLIAKSNNGNCAVEISEELLFIKKMLTLIAVPVSISTILINQKLWVPDLYNIIMLIIPLLIMIQGGKLLILNAVMQVEGRADRAALFQVIVPIVCLIVFVSFYMYGAVSLVVGMLVGQYINQYLAAWYLNLKKLTNYSGNPARIKNQLKELWPYFTIAIVATLPFNTTYALATIYDANDITYFAIGTKFVILISTAISMLFSSLVMPLMLKNHIVSTHMNENIDFSKTTNFLTFISLCFALISFIFADDIIRVLLKDAAEIDYDLLSRVFLATVIQIPFSISLQYTLRIIMLNKDYKAVFYTSLLTIIGIVLIGVSMSDNSLLSFAYMFSVSSILITLTSTFYIYLKRHINIDALVFVFTSWLLYLTFILSVVTNNIPTVVIIASAYVLLLLRQIGFEKVDHFANAK